MRLFLTRSLTRFAILGSVLAAASFFVAIAADKKAEKKDSKSTEIKFEAVSYTHLRANET